MSNENHKIKIDTANTNLFPAVIDYDFVKMRPRGGSCKIDFFFNGKLSFLLDNVDIHSNVFVRKDGLLFDNGIFLFDFSKIEQDAQLMADKIKNIGSDKIYIESSHSYSIKPLVDCLEGYEVVLMEFS